MRIKTFISEAEANTFIKTVKPLSLEYHKKPFCDKIVLIYNDLLTSEAVRKKKIEEDEREALTGLEEAQMHLEYLDIVASQSEDEAKLTEGSIKSTKQNIKNYQAKLKAIELWKKNV